MTTRRIGKLPNQRFDKLCGGWVCRNCGKIVPKGHRSWCNAACEQEAGIRAWPQMARQLVFKRDHGICARCGIDADALDAAVKELFSWHNRWGYGEDNKVQRAFLQANNLRMNRSHWEAHHKHAVIEGGGECGLDGYETLCWRCHSKETGQLRRRLNQQRAEICRLPLFQTTDEKEARDGQDPSN